MSFDTVVFTCPCCQKETEEQVGNGDYLRYTLETAPVEVLNCLYNPDRRVYCQECGERIMFARMIKIETVAKRWEPRALLSTEEINAVCKQL